MMRLEPSRAHMTYAAERPEGYAPIRDYGALGDGRSVALVARDGRVDWWPVPTIDAPPICAAIVDPGSGGFFALRPAGPAKINRRYLPGTNVIETIYSTQRGRARVTDSLNSGAAGRLPWTELARRIEGLDGQVEMTWELVPGDRFGQARPRVSTYGDVPVVTIGDQVLALVLSGTTAEITPTRVRGRLRCQEGTRALLSAVVSDDEPLYLPKPEEIDARIDRTIRSWRQWSRLVDYKGEWGAAVNRSALALKTLLYEPEGAIAAAATTSLPERVGGPKNWDYRYAWVRDSSFTLDTFIGLGLHEEVQASVSWMLAALRNSHPHLQVFYTLEGDVPGGEDQLESPGYRGSQPVRAGNKASSQTQLGTYGDLFDMVHRYVDAGHILDEGTRELLTGLADECCAKWSQKDSGIWELSKQEHYTISKIGCWVALDRAADMARRGQLSRRKGARWRREATEITRWARANCWSRARRSYTFYAGTEELDAAVLLAGRTGFDRGQRLASSIEAIVGELAHGPLLYRYSGMEKEEGAFVACSFWLVSALTYVGQVDRARALMDDCIKQANDLGLFSEQIDPSNGEFLGNIPQGLSHLALIDAAQTLMRYGTGRPRARPVPSRRDQV
jgi:GH15 family glucan-1,4-alpha-glucosidase